MSKQSLELAHIIKYNNTPECHDFYFNIAALNDKWCKVVSGMWRVINESSIVMSSIKSVGWPFSNGLDFE